MGRALPVLKLLLTFFFCAAAPLLTGAQQPRQKIRIAGAQSLVPLAEKFSAQFRKDHPEREIEIWGGGSNYALDAVRRGEIDIGLITRSPNAQEKAGLYLESFGRDAIVILTYPGNPVRSLTLEQIRKIYTGEITNWRAVGGEERGIIPLTREKSAGIHTLFIDHLFGQGFNGREKAFTLRASKEKVLKTIKRIEGSVGYGILRLEQAEAQGIKVLGVNGKLPTDENIHTGLYPLTRPQLLIARGRPDGSIREWMLGFARLANQDAKPGQPP